MIHTGMHQSESDSAAKHNLCQEIILNIWRNIRHEQNIQTKGLEQKISKDYLKKVSGRMR
jgi:hypothetical protein